MYYFILYCFSLGCMLVVGQVASIVRPSVRGTDYFIEAALGALGLASVILLLPYVLHRG